MIKITRHYRRVTSTCQAHWSEPLILVVEVVAVNSFFPQIRLKVWSKCREVCISLISLHLIRVMIEAKIICDLNVWTSLTLCCGLCRTGVAAS